MSKKFWVIFSVAFLVSCGGGGGGGGSSEPTPPPTPAASVNLSADPLSVLVGNQTTLTWSTSYASSCSASGSWSGSKPTAGTEDVDIETTGDNQFILTCSGSGGSGSDSVTVEGYENTSAFVVDGYITGAQVFIDQNDNFISDLDEPESQSSDSGSVVIKKVPGTFVSIGGRDFDTQNSLENLLLLHKNSNEIDNRAITPLTSVAAFLNDESLIHSIIGLDETLDIYQTDPVANKGTEEKYNVLYEKGNQLTVLTYSIQEVVNTEKGTIETSQDFFAALAEELDQEYVETNDQVNIESSAFIEKVLVNALERKALELDEETKTNLVMALASLMPVIQVKDNDTGTGAIFNFATSTLITDLKAIADGTIDADILTAYQEDILNYVAEDQNIDLSEIAPEISAGDDLLLLDEDEANSINILNNDSFVVNSPIAISLGASQHGTESLNGGTVTYTPEEDYFGKDEIAYTLSQSGLTTSAVIDITVNPTPDAPEFTSGANFSVQENQTDVTTLKATDADGDEISYSLTGTDAASFNLEESSGILTFKEPPDFEAKDTFGIIATASDGTNTTDKDLTIRVTNVNDVAPEFTSENTFYINENETEIGTVTAFDSEGDELSFSTSSNELLISNSGVLSFISAPDFEIKNTYSATITVSDGVNTTDQETVVNIINVDEPPYIVDLEQLNFIVDEKSKVIGNFFLVDPEGDSISYSEVAVDYDDGNGNLITHNNGTGNLQFRTCPTSWDDNCYNDYEKKSFYEGQFLFGSGDFIVSEDITIQITDVNESPSFGACEDVGTNPPSFPAQSTVERTINENETDIIILETCDPEQDTLTFTSTNPLHKIDNSTGRVYLDSPIDFEDMECDPLSGEVSNTCWSGVITSSDGELTDEILLVVRVRNLNDTSPVFTSTQITTPENQTIIGQVLATDPDGDDLVFDVEGPDFSITSEGVLSFSSIVPDYESRSNYTALVTASDGVFSTQETVLINISDVDEAPTVTFEETIFVPENQEYIVTFSASDPENTLLTFRSGCNLPNGGSLGPQFCNVESGFFDFPNCEDAPVEGNVVNVVCSGELHFKPWDVPDYENPVDSGNNNTFNPIFYVEDNSGYGNRTAFSPNIIVTNVNDNQPIFVSQPLFSVNENETSIGTVIVEDADEDEILFSTSSADISINSLSGALTFNSPPNFESKNTYSINVTANDGANQINQNIKINVLDVDEGATNTASECDVYISNARDNEFRYCWQESQDNSGAEYSANVNEPITVTFGGSAIEIPEISYAELLYSDYGVILSDGEVAWTNDYAYALYESMKKTPLEYQGEGEDRRSFSNWTLTDDFITDDITLTSVDDGLNVLLSTATLTNANPRIAEIEGKRGKFFSNRLFKAVVRFISNNGANQYIIEQMLSNRYGVSINIDDYQALTGEPSTRFQDFQPEELVRIIAMFEEMPTGYHKVQGFNYLVRRLNGAVNELYPEAPAIAWVGSGYVEFMEAGFDSDSEDYVHRLILHEKAHFMWGATHDQADAGQGIFDATLKADWIELGGWYECTERESGWCTTKQTEFVSAYAHSKNPNEDMAESLSYFVVNPDALRSRSLAKYEFVRDRVMQGNIYISQIREDLTFEVYNLFPDYVFPGKIKKLQVSLNGAPNEDKSLVVEVELHALDEVLEGAATGFMRIFSPVGTFIDFYLNPYDGNTVSTRLRSNPISISKFVKSGFWKVNNITLTDAVGNIRNFGANDFGWRLHINSPLEDIVKPVYVDDSIAFTKTVETIQDQEVDILNITWDTVETNPRENQGCYGTVNDEVITTYSLEQYAPSSYSESELYSPNQCYLRYAVPNYMPSGTYSISYAKMFDQAGNVGEAYFQPPNDSVNSGWDNPDDPSPTVTFETSNPDITAPELDLNDIGITAVPTNPDAPNGETVVTFRFRVKDDISGYQIGSYYFRDPQGLVNNFYHYPERGGDLFPTSQDLDWYEYESTVILPPGSAPGTWGVTEFTLRDRAQNYKTYNFTEIVSFQVDN